jgi:hypothetical protein
MGNNNFLEEEYEEIDSGLEEVVEEIVEEYEEDVSDSQQASSVINEAMKRIEQANLYKALLDHQLFSPGSARPEIIAIVRKEFKTFILSRLEILLGIKQEANVQLESSLKAKSAFDDGEVEALKAIAKRLSSKQPTSSPTINSVEARTPQIQPLETKTVPQIQEVQPQTVSRKVIRRVVKRQPEQSQIQPQPQTQAQAVRGRKKRSDNTSVFTGQDLSQAINEAKPPMKMPSQMEIDMLNARQAEMNARGGATAGVGAAITQILNPKK